ncbi:MAG: Ig domain-containing protein [bacterium]
MGLIIIGMFSLTLYNLSAPRSTLKNILGIKRVPWGTSAGDGATDQLLKLVQEGKQDGSMDKLVNALTLSARVNKRTTRATLAIAGFSFLAVIVVALLGLSGPGVRDLRNQVFAAVTTLVATIAGFYFGAQTAGSNSAGNAAGPGGDGTAGPPVPTAPRLAVDPEPTHSTFTVGRESTYQPKIMGSPAPTVTIRSGALPNGLKLDRTTAAITGTPASDEPEGEYPVTLTADNGVPPAATLPITLSVRRTPSP